MLGDNHREKEYTDQKVHSNCWVLFSSIFAILINLLICYNKNYIKTSVESLP